MQLSIIVPVYNMEADEKLKYCLDSLLKQTITNYEIIAVDDKSTDTSLLILEEYQKTHPKQMRVIASPINKKQGGAKNLGLEVATGQWIGFIDSDDWIAPTMYEELIQKAEETGADLVGCDYNLVHSHTMEVGQIISNNTIDQTGELTEEAHKKLFLRSGSMVIKIYQHKVIQENKLRFPEDIFYEDNCAGPLWSLYFKRFEKVEKPMYYYYQHITSTVHQISIEKCNHRLAAGEQLVLECKNRGFYEQYQKELEFRFTEIYYATTLFSYVSGVKFPRLYFLKKLKTGIKEQFPDFQKNTYYFNLMGKEEQKLIGFHMKSNLCFIGYYKCLKFYRNIKAIFN